MKKILFASIVLLSVLVTNSCTTKNPSTGTQSICVDTVSIKMDTSSIIKYDTTSIDTTKK